MTTPDNQIELRQKRHQKRARRARWAGRLLIPVFGLLISAALWSDPDISKQLERGLSVMAEMTGSNPDEDMMSDFAPTPASQDAASPTVRSLPKSRVKVNRFP